MSILINHLARSIAIAALTIANQVFASGKVIAYPETPLPQAVEFSVKADGHEISVYDAGTFRCAPFAFSGAITVEVTYQAGEIHSYQINPLSKGIVARQSGHTLTFTLTKPEKLEIQINGATSQVVDGNKLLYLFADAPEASVPKPDDPNVIYLGPGDHSPPGGIVKIDDSNPNSAMYLAPGAVLNAALEIKRTKQFKVYGRGFIRNPFKTKDHYALRMDDCINLLVEDVILFDSISHSIKYFGGHNNVVRNVKTLHYIVNTDGISFHHSTYSNLVENCFIIGNDNLIVIGGGEHGSDGKIGVAYNIIRNCTFIKSSYAGNWGFPQGDGPIGPGNIIDDCDVIRCNGEVGLLRMFWAKPTTVDNLTFQNIRVQSLDGYAPNSAKTGFNRFLSLESDGREYARSITLKDIYLPSAQTSFIAAGNWRVVFDHVYVAGKLAKSDVDLNLTKGEGVLTSYIY